MGGASNGSSQSWTGSPLVMFQVIHLWFEDFALEDSILCQSDSVSVKDDLGMIGEDQRVLSWPRGGVEGWV